MRCSITCKLDYAIDRPPIDENKGYVGSMLHEARGIYGGRRGPFATDLRHRALRSMQEKQRGTKYRLLKKGQDMDNSFVEHAHSDINIVGMHADGVMGMPT